MAKKFEHNFFACGKNGIPEEIDINENPYVLDRIFKHDFFAATALYHPKTDQTLPMAVLKMQRTQSFFAIPMAWAGAMLSRGELKNLEKIAHVENTPSLIKTHGKNGFIYKFIPGQTLDKAEHIPDDFFDKLADVLRDIHRANIAYLDMNKRNNIIVGDDGNAYIIDFQISKHIRKSKLRRRLQAEDWFHFYKHKKKLMPHMTNDAEKKLAKSPSALIRLHRCISTPYKKIRRPLLRALKLNTKKYLKNSES